MSDECTDDLLNKFKSLDGITIRTSFQPVKKDLAKDEKGAMINDLVDKYLRKELTDEYLQQVKEEHRITSKDIIREIAKRQIEKAMGT